MKAEGEKDEKVAVEAKDNEEPNEAEDPNASDATTVNNISVSSTSEVKDPPANNENGTSNHSENVATEIDKTNNQGQRTNIPMTEKAKEISLTETSEEDTKTLPKDTTNDLKTEDRLGETGNEESPPEPSLRTPEENSKIDKIQIDQNRSKSQRTGEDTSGYLNAGVTEPEQVTDTGPKEVAEMESEVTEDTEPTKEQTNSILTQSIPAGTEGGTKLRVGEISPESSEKTEENTEFNKIVQDDSPPAIKDNPPMTSENDIDMTQTKIEKKSESCTENNIDATPSVPMDVEDSKDDDVRMVSNEPAKNTKPLVESKGDDAPVVPNEPAKKTEPIEQSKGDDVPIVLNDSATNTKPLGESKGDDVPIVQNEPVQKTELIEQSKGDDVPIVQNEPVKKTDPLEESKDDDVPLVANNTTVKTEPIEVLNERVKETDPCIIKIDPLDEAFKDFRNIGDSKKTRVMRRRQTIKIKIKGMASTIPTRKVGDPKATDGTDSLNSLPYDLNAMEKELEDSLKFFEEPHEEQDPAYNEFLKHEKINRIEAELKSLKEEEEVGKRDIVAIVNSQLKARQQSTEQQVEKHRQKTAADHKKEMTRLQTAYNEKSRTNQGRIDQGVAVLRKKHADENQKYIQQHRQQIQQRRVPEHVANAEWQQIAQRLNAKHSRQMHEFSRKGKEVLNKCKLDFEREQARSTKAYEKRVQDLNSQRQTIHSRLHSNYNQMKQRHVKRHIQSIAKRRQSMESELAACKTPTQDFRGDEMEKKQHELIPEKPKSHKEENDALRPVSPIKTAAEWRKESHNESSGAATRHKHRKGVLSQIARQLSVEIHNEGIWLSEISENKPGQSKKDDSASSGGTSESEKKAFFPWGYKARKILESIVCGEIPHACKALKLNFTATAAQNGSHIRCLMTDLRTSDATASSQRAEAIMKKEIDELKKLEAKDASLKSTLGDIKKGMDIIQKQQHDLGVKLKETLKDLEKTKLHLQAFRSKYSRYFGSDGKPLPTNNPEDTRKLTQAGMKYRVAIQSSEKRAMAIKSKMSELQTSLQKRQQSTEQGERASTNYNAEIKAKKTLVNDVRSGRLNLVQTQLAANATTRVKDTINILGLTADMRRDLLNQKRNSNTSSNWVQSLPHVPPPLRRSLWYKMHRRRQQIVLRPTFSSMLTSMRDEVKSKLTANDRAKRMPKSAIEDELIKAEQAYLLVSHPVELFDENVSSVPSSLDWAEPGWHLKLHVDKEDRQDKILPCPPMQPLVQHNLSELYSAPGSQAASMINSTHLRSLETPLSAVATATSLAETDPAMAKSADPILSSNDPLRMTRDVLKLGYSFSITKAPIVKPTVTRRKSSSSTKDATAPFVSTKTMKKRTSATAVSDSAASKATSSNPSSSKIDKTRKRKIVVPAESAPPSRVMQRQRSEAPIPLPTPLDDQAFQPRPIMNQPQQAPQQQAPPPQQQQQPGQSSSTFMPQSMPQQQQNPYNNQYMNTMQSPVTGQQQASHRGSFNQYQNAPQINPQMNQFRMMQQQQQQPPSHHQQQHHQQRTSQQNYGQIQQQAMRPNPQFFPQMGQQFPQQQMQMPGQGAMQMNHPQGPNQGRQPMGSDEQHDPLFMLKDLH